MWRSKNEAWISKNLLSTNKCLQKISYFHPNSRGSGGNVEKLCFSRGDCDAISTAPAGAGLEALRKNIFVRHQSLPLNLICKIKKEIK
jgi:hypothetical protein